MTIEKLVGINIKKRRIELKMTQNHLAIVANISRQYVYDIEHGRKSLTLSTLDKIREVLDVDFAYFFTALDANS